MSEFYTQFCSEKKIWFQPWVCSFGWASCDKPTRHSQKKSRGRHHKFTTVLFRGKPYQIKTVVSSYRNAHITTTYRANFRKPCVPYETYLQKYCLPPFTGQISFTIKRIPVIAFTVKLNTMRHACSPLPTAVHCPQSEVYDYFDYSIALHIARVDAFWNLKHRPSNKRRKPRVRRCACEEPDRFEVFCCICGIIELSLCSAQQIYDAWLKSNKQVCSPHGYHCYTANDKGTTMSCHALCVRSPQFGPTIMLPCFCLPANLYRVFLVTAEIYRVYQFLPCVMFGYRT